AVKRAECLVGGIGVMRKKKPVLERTRAISPSPRPLSPSSSTVLSAPANPLLRKQSSSRGSGGSNSRENSKEEDGKKGSKSRPDCESLWRYFKDQRKDSHRLVGGGGVVPSIEVTPSRRVSISSPLRFTRTCSQDSLESIERVCRKELRRKLLETPQEAGMSLLPSPAIAMSPSLSDIGRSNTNPEGTASSPVDLSRPASVCLKRSVGDVRDPPSPTKKTLSEAVGLTAYQQKLLIQCWPNIYSTGPGGQFASAIFNRLQTKCPKAKQLLAKANGVAVFANSDIDCTAMHSRVTIELIDTAIRNLDADSTKLTNYLNEVGRSHRHLRHEGLTIGVWDDLADVLMDCVCRYDAVKKHKELRRAWLALFAYICDNMKNGQTIFRSSSSYEITDNGSPVSSIRR
ncbi:hypothetical protein PMAYCL1PPCAC_29889, partial [Pristionchus mayeri]